MKAPLVVTLICAAWAATACSVPPPLPDPSPVPATAAPSDPTTVTSRATASPTPLPVVASRTTTANATVLVSIHPVHSSDAVSTVSFTVRNVADRPQTVSVFGDGRMVRTGSDSQVHTLNDTDHHTVDGVFILDHQRQARLLPARDADGICACSSTKDLNLPPGDEVTLAAVFAGLPADVTSVSVHIPRAGMFDDVPVLR